MPYGIDPDEPIPDILPGKESLPEPLERPLPRHQAPMDNRRANTLTNCKRSSSSRSLQSPGWIEAETLQNGGCVAETCFGFESFLANLR